MSTVKQNYGGAAMFAGAAVGGAFVGSIAQKKISFLNTVIGRIVLIVFAIFVFAKAKSETIKAAAAGLAVSGASGFINDLAGTVNGIEGLSGFGGVGELVQDENGMMYMVNGMGELEEFYPGMVEGAEEYEESFSGFGSNVDEALALS